MEKDDAKWTPETEIALFKAMQDHKPVGKSRSEPVGVIKIN